MVLKARKSHIVDEALHAARVTCVRMCVGERLCGLKISEVVCASQRLM